MAIKNQLEQSKDEFEARCLEKDKILDKTVQEKEKQIAEIIEVLSNANEEIESKFESIVNIILLRLASLFTFIHHVSSFVVLIRLPKLYLYHEFKLEFL